MARTDRQQGRGVSPLRLVAILLFLVVLTGGMAYLFAMPLKQLYWGGASSCRPLCLGASPMRAAAAPPIAAS